MKLIKDGVEKNIEDINLAKAMISAGWKEVIEKPVEKETIRRTDEKY